MSHTMSIVTYIYKNYDKSRWTACNAILSTLYRNVNNNNIKVRINVTYKLTYLHI